MGERSAQLTDVLRAWARGDESALGKAIELAYPELREIAQRCLRMERSEHTMQATALAHEAYLRLIDVRNLTWQAVLRRRRPLRFCAFRRRQSIAIGA
jgi:hypothetical protein